MKATYIITIALLALVDVGVSRAYYNPQQGRWLSRDPVAGLKSPNLYEFNLSAPIKYIDPDGRTPKAPTDPTSATWDLASGGSVNFDPSTLTSQTIPAGHSVPTFVGGETHFIVGSGFTRVQCCDENRGKRVFWYRKLCIGGAAGFGAGGGVVVSGLSGRNCRGENYEGWFYELGGSAGPIASGGVDIGYTDDGSLSGVNEIGGGLGASHPGFMIKSTWCYYTLITEKIAPCGCEK